MWVSVLAWPRAKAALASLGLSFQAIRQWPCAALSGSGAAQSGRPRSKPMDRAWALSSAWRWLAGDQGRRAVELGGGGLEAVLLGGAVVGRQFELDQAGVAVLGEGEQFVGVQLLVGRQGEEYAGLGLVGGDGDGQAAAVGQVRLFDVRLVRLLLPEQQAGAEQRDEGERHDVAPFRFAHGAVFLNVGPDR